MLSTTSRFRFCQAVRMADGTMMLTDREPFRFVELPDTVVHKAQKGESWWSIAATYYNAPGLLENPTDLWWVIADFQPEPVVDPTIAIQGGQLIFVPSLSAILLHVFDEDRRVLFR